MTRRVLLGLCMLSSFPVPAYAGRIPITACHQSVVGGSAELTADLDCSAMPLAIGVEVQSAKLFLNGHTISGAEIGVACVEKCKIYGPGTITGNVEGIETVSSKPNGGVVMVSDATVSGNDAVGIAGDKVKIIGSTLDNNGGLVVEGHVVGGGIVATGQVTVRSSTIGGNLTHGVCTPERIRLVKSIVQANGTAPGCEPNASCAACGDLVSDTRPIVNPKSTCDTSVHPPTDTWGVCSTD